MKILSKVHKLSEKRHNRKKGGFALIATLTLMMLLAMLAVALLSLASSQQRIAMQTVMLAEARQQALVGLDAFRKKQGNGTPAQLRQRGELP